jgi:hypothetical protein
MSAVLPGAAAADEARPAPNTRRGARVPGWLREPLLHFVLLGAALFAIDHAIASREDDPRLIVVGPEVDDEAKRLFAASRGRAPNADELKALRDRWIDNEVLYREGLALRVDRGDTAIRERVIFKALSVVDAGVKLPTIDDKQLRAWFEARHAKYDEPPRFDFQEAVAAGDASESAQRAFVEALNAGTPGDVRAGLRMFKGRPRENLVQSYGPEFAQALESAPIGQWRAQPSKEGLRAIRLEAITPARPADFEMLRGVVLQDWTDATLAEQRSAAVRSMAQKYTVKIAGAAR